jgi:hypothetical protein
MITIPPERAKELRDGLITIKQEALKKGWNDDVLDCDDTIAILDDYSALKAEAKRLNTWHSTLSEAWKARAIKAEAQLAKQAPLIDVIMEGKIDRDALGRSYFYETKQELAVLRAALALREEKGK